MLFVLARGWNFEQLGISWQSGNTVILTLLDDVFFWRFFQVCLKQLSSGRSQTLSRWILVSRSFGNITECEVFQRSTDTSVRISRSLIMFPQEIVAKLFENDTVRPPSPPPHPVNPLSGQKSSTPPLIIAAQNNTIWAEGWTKVGWHPDGCAEGVGRIRFQRQGVGFVLLGFTHRFLEASKA